MKYRSGIFFFIFLLYSLPAIAQFNTIPINQAEFSKLPVYNRQRVHIQKDWLINKITQQAKVYRTKGDHLIISNGLISRAFSLEPNGATIAYINLMTGTSLLRAIRPEAKIDINGIWYDIGGLTGQPIQAYFRPVWLDSMKANPTAWKLTVYKIGKIQARLKWKKMLKWMPQNLPWPPHGITLTFRYRINNKILKNLHVPPVDHLGYLTHVIIDVHYALYDGIPLLCKWVTVENHSEKPIDIVHFISEILATPEAESQPYGTYDGNHWLLPNITVQTNYEFGGATGVQASLGKSVHWNTDPIYKSQVSYGLNTKCLLETYPNWGPAQDVKPGGHFSTFRTWELIHDSWNRERKGLEIRKMYRTIDPWVTENPIYFSVIKSDTKSVKRAINQAAAVGFQMVVMSFGSGFNIEDTSKANYRRMTMLRNYARSKGIALGGYSLLASRHIGGGNDVVMPKGMRPVFGHSPDLGSRWGLDYFHKLYKFFSTTGMNDFINDGSYPGDVSKATWQPGHKGLADSQWKQFKIITRFYHWCLAKGVYLIVPDWYFMNGSNKTAMGYRETDWSLPRRRQEIIERQNIYDGTWTKTPSMGWMFVPLTIYHGGGAAATIVPLRKHLSRYQQAFADLFGGGVSGNFRGLQLYDSPKTEALVRKWVSFYKKHFAILNSDIIHVRRPDGQNISCILHVNPFLKTKGMAMIYNPLDHSVSRNLTLPLYYTGLSHYAYIQIENGRMKRYTLNRKYKVTVPIKIKANSYTWILIK